MKLELVLFLLGAFVVASCTAAGGSNAPSTTTDAEPAPVIRAAPGASAADEVHPVAAAPRARELAWSHLVEKCREVPGWKPSQSAHYFFASAIDDEAFLAAIRERAEAIRAEIVKLFPHPELDPVDLDRAPTVVRVMEDRDEYVSYGGPPGSVGYFSAPTGELVMYDARASGRKSETFETLQGLAFRAYLAELQGVRQPAAWFYEGFSAYFASFAPVDGALVPRRESALRPLYEHAVEQRTLVHVHDLLVANRRAMWEHDELRAEAWAFVWFLLRGQARDANGRGAWDAFLPTYWELWRTGSDEAHARDTASRGLDWGALERAMRDAVLGAQPASPR